MLDPSTDDKIETKIFDKIKIFSKLSRIPNGVGKHQKDFVLLLF
jgi:hypothetical protein